jgi:hypothetical protein
VDQKNILISGRTRRDEIRRRSYVFIKQSIMYAFVFLGWKNVRADGEKIIVAIYQLEREHVKPGCVDQRGEPENVLSYALARELEGRRALHSPAAFLLIN